MKLCPPPKASRPAQGRQFGQERGFLTVQGLPGVVRFLIAPTQQVLLIPHHAFETINEFVIAPTTLFCRKKRLLKRGTLNNVTVLYRDSIENWNLRGETYVRIEIHGGRKDGRKETTGRL